MSQTSTKVQRTSHLRWVNVAEIKVDENAQRKLNKNFVAKLAPDFDPEKLGYPVLNKREDGSFYVIDGQHRVELMRVVGWGDQALQCEVYEGLTLEEEAAVFLDRNRRLNIRTFDKFRIRITKGDAVACDIDRIVRAQGLRVAQGPQDRNIQAVAALEKVYDLDFKALVRTLVVLPNAFGVNRQVFDSSIIEGVGRVCHRFNGEMDDARLIAQLQKGGTNTLLGKASVLKKATSRSVVDCVAAAVVETYNAGKGGKKLPSWWKS